MPRTSRTRRPLRGLTALIALGLLSTSCAQSPAASPQQPDTGSPTASAQPDSPDGQPVLGGTLRVIHVTNPSSLDPHSGASGNDHHSLYPLYDRLINFDPATLAPQPGLATSWDFVDDTTLVLQLREGVIFHDGTPLDAVAVQYNLTRGMTLETSAIRGDLAAVDSVDVSGPFEVTIRLNRPDASLILLLADRAGMMVSPTAAEELGEEFATNPVGTGPFTFERWLPNDRLELSRNQNYWMTGLPYLDGIEIRYVTDGQAGNNALLDGQADFKHEVQAVDIATLEASSDIRVVVGPSLFYGKAYPNMSRPPFDDVRVRRAVNMALDRQALVDALQFGYGQPAHQPVPPEHWAFQHDLNPWPHDPDAARDLIREAGLEGYEFTCLVVDIPGYPRLAEVLQASLADIGLQMKIEVAEVSSSLKRFFEEDDAELFLAGSTGRPDPQVTMNMGFSTAGYFHVGELPDGIDGILADAVARADIPSRHEAYGNLYRLIQDQALEIPTTFFPSAVAFHDDVQGYHPTLIGKPDVSFLWLDR